MAVPAREHPRPTAATPPPGESELWPRPEDFPNVHELVIEDGKPVDNIFAEKQMRLLTEPLHSGWPGPDNGEPFVAMANVGVFHTGGEPPIVPDALLAAGVRQGDLALRENRSYFVWLRGKVPDVVTEIVSNREGGEDTDKMRIYARIGVPYYAIYDPENSLRSGPLRVYKLSGRTYELLSPPYSFAEVGLGMDIWQGRYEDMEAAWLRWCDRSGELIPTGAERAQRAEHLAVQAEDNAVQAQQQAAQAQQQAAQAQQLATEAEQREATERRAAELAQQELQRLKEKLRTLGIEPGP